SAKDVAAIIAQIKKQKAAAVFLENVTDPRLVEQIARETGAKVGGTLYSDALTDDKGDATTSIDLIRHNLRRLASALVSRSSGNNRSVGSGASPLPTRSSRSWSAPPRWRPPTDAYIRGPNGVARCPTRSPSPCSPAISAPARPRCSTASCRSRTDRSTPSSSTNSARSAS